MGFIRLQEEPSLGYNRPDEETEFYSAQKSTIDRTFFKVFINFFKDIANLNGAELKLFLVICSFMNWTNIFRLNKVLELRIMTYMSMSNKHSLEKLFTRLCKKGIIKRIEPKTYKVSEKLVMRREDPFKKEKSSYFFKVYDEIYKVISLPTEGEIRLLLAICSFMSWNNTIKLDKETTSKIMYCLSIKAESLVYRYTLSLCKKGLLEKIGVKTYKINEALFTKQAEPHIKRQREERQKKEQELFEQLLLRNMYKN